MYVIQDVAGKLACNQPLIMPGWPNGNENIEKIEPKTEKHCHCRRLINIALCVRKKNFKNSAVTTQKVMILSILTGESALFSY